MSQKKVIFIHAALLSGCVGRINQYLEKMVESGLFHAFTHMYICYLGTTDIPILKYQDPRIVFVHLSKDLEQYEVQTQHFMWEFCKQNLDSDILYMHTKGVGKQMNLCIEDWVAYMIYFLIGKWQICHQVLETSATTGVDLRSEPTLHYSGNFWWAKASYLASLPDPILFQNLELYPNPLNSPRHNQEFWICHDKTANHTSLWDSGINVYNRHVYRYPANLYNI